METINYDNWFEKYKPQLNHFTSSPDNDNYTFETFGEELEYVKSQHQNRVWTLLDCDNEESWIIPGYSWINRMGFFITEIPWESEDIQVNDNEMCTVEEAINHCISFGEKTFKIALDKNDVTLHFNENLDSTFNGEITTSKAKYIATDYFEDRLEKDMEEFEDEIHNYYLQL